MARSRFARDGAGNGASSFMLTSVPAAAPIQGITQHGFATIATARCRWRLTLDEPGIPTPVITAVDRARRRLLPDEEGREGADEGRAKERHPHERQDRG